MFLLREKPKNLCQQDLVTTYSNLRVRINALGEIYFCGDIFLRS